MSNIFCTPQSIIIEGPDNVGKGTQIQIIREYIAKKNIASHYLHYSNIKGISNKHQIERISKCLYTEMFQLIDLSSQPRIVMILDRAHLGEFVYSPMYRHYSGDYVWDLEKDFKNRNIGYMNTKLIVFIDNPENLVKRDDGLSFSIELDKKKEEVERFVKAYETSVLQKKLINIKNKSIDDVWFEVKEFLF